jgi:hypothetical protein
MSDDAGRIWSLGVSPWIIQDGNYADFEASGPSVAFVLEFYTEHGLTRASPADVHAVEVDTSNYRVLARVAHVDDGWWVIDFGVLAYCERTPPTGVSVGDYVAGELYLGIDPYFYFEYLCRSPGAPALVYEWQVEAIVRETSPLVRSPTDPRTWIPDASRRVEVSVARTDAWREDGSTDRSLHYTLRCRPLGGPRYPANPGRHA